MATMGQRAGSMRVIMAKISRRIPICKIPAAVTSFLTNLSSMGRLPNHRFSVTRKRETTRLESGFDTLKRHITHPFSKAQTEEVILVRGPSTPSYDMGKNGRRRGEEIDWDEIAASSSSHENERAFQGNESRGRRGNRDVKSNSMNNGNYDTTAEVERMPEKDATPGLGRYPEAVADFNQQIAATHEAMKKVMKLYKSHQRDIQEVDKTRQRLSTMTNKYQGYRAMVKEHEDLIKEKDEQVANEKAAIERQKKGLDEAEAKVKKQEEHLAIQKTKLETENKKVAVAQERKLNEERAQLEEEQNRQYKMRVDALEKETKKREHEIKKTLEQLAAENKLLSEKLDAQKSQLEEVKVQCKDQTRLKQSFEAEVEKLTDDLSKTQNEFGLNTETTEYYKDKFGKISDEIQDISEQYFKELHVNEWETIQEKMQKLDPSFASVPISSSEVSQKLRIAHAQRVISSHLREIIWQPFSSEIIQQDPDFVTLLTQISEGLRKSNYNGNGLRAARVCEALINRGLGQSSTGLALSVSRSPQDQPHGRAEEFIQKVMGILSLLVKSSLHPNLQNRLVSLANSAISVWNMAQTDEREILVHSSLDPANLEQWRALRFHKITTDEDMSPPHDGVFVLIPHITARSYPQTHKPRPIGPPGMWIESEPEPPVQEVCILNGLGLAQWSALVLDGAEEENEIRNNAEIKRLDDERREWEEKMKIATGSSRRISQSSRRDSTAGQFHHTHQVQLQCG